MSNLSDFSKAQVGDKAWDFRKGWGTIYSIKYDNNYPVTVTFPFRERETYKIDGKAYASDEHASLFHDEVQFEVPPPPKRMVEKVFHLFVNLYPDGLCYAYRSRQEADESARLVRIGEAEEVIIRRIVEEKP